MDRELGGLTRDAGKYFGYWLLFGLLAGLTKPVGTGDFWAQKVPYLVQGIVFGLACALVFTLLQNGLNQERDRGKFWGILFLVWMGMKFVFLGVGLALGLHPA